MGNAAPLEVCYGKDTEEKRIEESNDDKKSQRLAFTTKLLSDEERESILTSSGELGNDPSSQFFVKRTKNIAYVVKLHGEWFQINKDYFIQNAAYNDLSGGYKRSYKTMSPQFTECKAVQKMLNSFQKTFGVPDNELVLVQVQRSHIEINKEMMDDEMMEHDINPDGEVLEEEEQQQQNVKPSKTARILSSAPTKPTHKAQASITGQGIHTDGADHLMLVCLERKNIDGAQNSVYYDLEGDQTLIEPFVLKEGTAMFWQDNKVYHYVNPARLVNRKKSGSRTVLIAVYPAIYALNGTANPNNTLRRNVFESSRQIRNLVAQDDAQ